MYGTAHVQVYNHTLAHTQGTVNLYENLVYWQANKLCTRVECLLRDFPHTLWVLERSTCQVETCKLVLASKQFLAQVLACLVNVCVM